MALPTFLESFLEDLVFEKYGVEMEQLNLEPEELTNELLDKLHMLKQLKNSLVEAMTSGGGVNRSEGSYEREGSCERDADEGEGEDEEL